MRKNRIHYSRLWVAVFIVVGVLTPFVASAVSWIPVVPCGRSDQDICTPCHLLQTGKNVIDLVLFGVTGPIAAFMIVLAGGMMLLGGGNPALFGRGKKYLTNTLTGVAIILVAWSATNFLIKGLGNGAAGDSWYQFTCPQGLAEISAIDTEFQSPLPVATPPSGTIPTPPPNVGTFCSDSTILLCGTAEDLRATCTPCNNFRRAYGSDVFQRYAHGVATPGLLESIMLNESSCARNLKSPAGAYGPMQLLPSTANLLAGQCGVPVQDKDGNQTPINGAWLMSEANWEKSLCLASAFIATLTGTCGTDARNIAAGYNGGPEACEPSNSCQGLQSCAGGLIRKWECVWENRQHTLCNANRIGGGYRETRGYAPKVAACAQEL